MFQYSPILGRSSIWDPKYAFSTFLIVNMPILGFGYMYIKSYFWDLRGTCSSAVAQGQHAVCYFRPCRNFKIQITFDLTFLLSQIYIYWLCQKLNGSREWFVRKHYACKDCTPYIEDSHTPRTLRACCSQSKFRILKIRESSARALFFYNCTLNNSRSADASVA